MHGLSHKNRIKHIACKGRVFGRANVIRNARVREPMPDLFGADVRRFEARKKFRACHRRLAVAGSAIPGQLVLVGQTAEMIKQASGIGGAMPGVLV